MLITTALFAAGHRRHGCDSKGVFGQEVMVEGTGPAEERRPLALSGGGAARMHEYLSLRLTCAAHQQRFLISQEKAESAALQICARFVPEDC